MLAALPPEKTTMPSRVDVVPVGVRVPEEEGSLAVGIFKLSAQPFAKSWAAIESGKYDWKVCRTFSSRVDHM